MSDERKELRLNGTTLPYSTFNRLSAILQRAIATNERLGCTLQFIKLFQDKRDNNHSQAIPAGNGLHGDEKTNRQKIPAFTQRDDMVDPLETLQSRSGEIFGTIKYLQWYDIQRKAPENHGKA